MRVSLIICFFLPLLTACRGQHKQPAQTKLTKDPTILTITASVSANKNIKVIKIKNHVNDTLKYFIGIEMWIDNEWGEAITDIHPDAPRMANLLLTLLPHADTSIKCDLTRSVPTFYQSDTALFRFKISYLQKVGEPMKYITSKEFNFTK